MRKKLSQVFFLILILILSLQNSQIVLSQDQMLQVPAVQTDSKYPKNEDAFGGKKVLDAEDELDNSHYADGVHMLQTELETAQKTNDIPKQAIIYNLLGLAMEDKHQYQNARNYIDKALQTILRTDEYLSLYIQSLLNLAEIDIKDNSLEGAKNCIEKAKSKTTLDSNLTLRLLTYKTEASYDSKKYDYKHAIILLNDALVMMDKEKYLSHYPPDQYIDTIVQLAAIYQDSGNYTLAHFNFNKALIMLNKYKLKNNNSRRFILWCLNQMNH